MGVLIKIKEEILRVCDGRKQKEVETIIASKFNISIRTMGRIIRGEYRLSNEIVGGLKEWKEGNKMPELPEVATIVKDIKSIEGCKVVFVKTFEKIESIRKTPLYDLKDRIIESVKRYGKYILIKFDKSALIIHLGMSGKIILEEGNELVPKHCHYLLQLDDKRQIRFIDHRHFGNIWHMAYKDALEYVQSRIGPEPFDIDPVSFTLRMTQTKYLDKHVKSVLLDQKVVAGLGNIYASEACYQALIHPKTLVQDLTSSQFEHLLYACRKVLKDGIKNNGTSFRDYRNAKNQTGNNQNFLGVYKQKTCRVYGHPVTKETVDGRSTYWCKQCLEEAEKIGRNQITNS